MFKNKLVILATIASVISILILTVGVSAGVWWLWDRSLPVSVLTVQGESSKKIKYDKVSINLTISIVGNDVSSLNSEIDTKTNKVINYLKSQNIAEDQIQTNKSSFPDYELNNFSEELDNKMPRQTRFESNFTITFIDFGQDKAKPNKVIAEVTKLGVNRFGGFNYDFNDNKKVCSDLENSAIEDGLKKAEDRVKFLGGSRITKKSVDLFSGCLDNQYSTLPFATPGSQSENVQGITPPPALGGEQEISRTVQLIIEYK